MSAGLNRRETYQIQTFFDVCAALLGFVLGDKRLGIE
jgi:hypothetical protein